jgi:hypothetical protein
VSGRAIKNVATFLCSKRGGAPIAAKRAEYSRQERGRNLVDGLSKKTEFPQLQRPKTEGQTRGGLCDRRTIYRKSSDLQGKFAEARGRRQNVGRLLKIPFRYQRVAKDVLDSLLLKNHAFRKFVDESDCIFAGCEQSVILPIAQQQNVEA